MAQVGMSTPRGSLRVTAKNVAASVSNSGTTVLLDIVTEAIEKVSFQVDNTVQALAAFIVEGRVHPDAAYVTIASAAGDFSAPSGRILTASGALVTLAAAASGRFDLDTSGLYSVRVSATGGNATPSVVSIYAGGSQAGQANSNITVSAGATTIADGGNTVEGATTDAAVSTDTTGTISGKLRGIVKLLVAKIGITIADGDAATVGVTTGAAVTTDANGTVQQYLRGLVKLFTTTTFKAASTLPALTDPAMVVTQRDPLPAGETHVGEVGGRNALVIASFARPGDTTAYTIGDLVANSTTTQSVVPMDFNIGRGASGVATTGMIRRARVRKTGKSTTSAQFRLHLWRANIGVQATVTLPVASPGIVTWTAHGLGTGAAVQFTNSGGGLPTGVVSGTTYYVIYIDANTFNLASSSANAYTGTQINFTGSSTGTHTGYQGTPVGDNGVFVPTNTLNYVGKIDTVCDQAFSDGASGNGVPAVGSEINFIAQHYYGLLEDRSGYTPIASEVFTVELEVLQN